MQPLATNPRLRHNFWSGFGKSGVTWGVCVGGGTAGEIAWDLQEERIEIAGSGCRKISLGGKCGKGLVREDGRGNV